MFPILRIAARAKGCSRLFSTTRILWDDGSAQLKELATEEAAKPAYSFSQQATSDIVRVRSQWKTFQPGTFIRPHQLTFRNRLERALPPKARPLINPSRKESRASDPFYKLGVDPLAECQNATLLSYYMSDMAKIKPRKETGLTAKSQRRMGKAIRRAKMMGVIPLMSKPNVKRW